MTVTTITSSTATISIAAAAAAAAAYKLCSVMCKFNARSGCRCLLPGAAATITTTTPGKAIIDYNHGFQFLLLRAI